MGWAIARFLIKYGIVAALGAVAIMHFYAQPRIDLAEANEKIAATSRDELKTAIETAKKDALKDATEREAYWVLQLEKEKSNHAAIVAALNADHQHALRLRDAADDRARRAKLRPPEARPTECRGFAAPPSDLGVGDADDLAAYAARANRAVAERNEAITALNDLWDACAK